MNRPVIAALWLVLLGGAGQPPVQTERGPVTGRPQADTEAWLGIPYAAPPVGPLRLRPPEPAASWTAPLAAEHFGPPCLQARGGVSGSEDCLYLNIWRPTQPGPARPVLVWIHGGAFQVGTSSVPYTAGAVLAAKGDIVVVTINYRLGAIGYLAAPALDAESPRKVSGNFGLLDQRAALRWVQRNIAAFGGDPANVTVAGESAGANSVLYHLTSPGSAGLFARAIAESPVENGHAPSLAASEAGASATVLKAVGCADAGDVAACLRALPAATLQAAGPVSPVVDGVVLPREPIAAFEAGSFNQVPVIIGSNHDEFTVFVARLVLPAKPPITDAAYAAEVANTFPQADAAEILRQYPVAAYPSPIQALATVETDGLVACPVRRARAALSAHVPTFGYEFNEANPAPGELVSPPVAGLTYGAYHTSELPYVFGLAARDGAPLTGKDLALSDRMIGAWSNMVKTGDPTGLPDHRHTPTIISWQDSRVTLTDDAFAHDHHCGFWSKLPAD